MKKIVLLIGVLLFCGVSVAQKKSKIKGNKNVVSDERTFGYFSKLEVNDKVKLSLRQGNQTKLEIEADENLHDVIDTDIDNSTLSISLNKRITNSKRFELTLYVEDLDYIELNDDSEIISSEKLEFFNIDIALNDKSDLEAHIEAQFLKLEANERSKAELIIKTDSVEFKLKESARLKSNLNTQKILIDHFGSSNSEFTGKTASLIINSNDNATFKGAEFKANEVIVNALNKSDSYLNAKNIIEINAKNKARIYIFNKPEITIKAFEDNASILKRESMTLLENL